MRCERFVWVCVRVYACVACDEWYSCVRASKAGISTTAPTNLFDKLLYVLNTVVSRCSKTLDRFYFERALLHRYIVLNRHFNGYTVIVCMWHVLIHWYRAVFFFGLLLLPLKIYKFIKIHNEFFSDIVCINWCSFLVIPADGIDLLLQFGLHMTKSVWKYFLHINRIW